MVTAVAFEDVKSQRKSRHNPKVNGVVTQTLFFGSSDDPDQPHASLNEPSPGLRSATHFHRVDQFQVVVGGKGKIGRHDLAPYCVHYTNAYTPYGPLRSSDGDGLKFFVMRAHHDAGSQHLPRELPQLNSVANRNPWQISRRVEFNEPSGESSLTPISGMQNERGLACFTLNMKPRTQATLPDPARGDGQYLVVLEGGVVLDGGERKDAPALVFSKPQDGALHIHAGDDGARALVLNFPQPSIHEVVAPQARSAAGSKRWQCELCAFVYDEALGMPDEGIAAGTRWEDVPESWSCPDCSATKSEFQMAEIKA